MPFLLPKFSEQYFAKIVERIGWLIHCQIWSDFDQAAFRDWLANFKTPEEKYLCACLLDSLIYRSEPQTLSLAKQIFQRSLPDVLRRFPPRVPLPVDWSARLMDHRTDPLVRLVAVVRPDDPPTKSAFIVARALKRHLKVSERWIISVEQAATESPLGIVFVDDFLGTGQQFCDFLDQSDLLRLLPDCYFVYAPLAAHEAGIQTVRSRFPSVRVATSDYLPVDSGVFSRGSFAIDDGLNSAQTGADFYFEFLAKVGITLQGIDRLGFGGLGLAYAFKHAVPDNSLPIFWWSKSASFHPLFDR